MNAAERIAANVRVLWCRITFRHLGEVGYFSDTGPFWMCDNCGTTVGAGKGWVDPSLKYIKRRAK